MKLVIQIPCYNEADTLPATLADLPDSIPGIDTVETLVIDDGSSDGTAEIAHTHGVTHVVRLKQNSGLAAAFTRGVDASLAAGADIIVSTDADNQYQGRDIGKLVEPIIEGLADMVIGARPINDIREFSFIKKRLQRLGSFVVRMLSGTEVPDATSGFRAYSREAAMKLVVLSGFTYTLETIIQSQYKGLTVVSVPINVNPQTRASRLFRSIPQYIRRSLDTMLRAYILFRPLKVLGTLGLLLMLPGVALFARWLYFYFSIQGTTGHIQSLIFAVVFVLLGFQIMVIGLIADLIAANRRFLENVLYRVKTLELDRSKDKLLAPESRAEAHQPVARAP
ncbi:glycosyltransferase family 2 protein [Myxococcota bacterium]